MAAKKTLFPGSDRWSLWRLRFCFEIWWLDVNGCQFETIWGSSLVKYETSPCTEGRERRRKRQSTPGQLVAVWRSKGNFYTRLVLDSNKIKDPLTAKLQVSVCSRGRVVIKFPQDFALCALHQRAPSLNCFLCSWDLAGAVLFLNIPLLFVKIWAPFKLVSDVVRVDLL